MSDFVKLYEKYFLNEYGNNTNPTLYNAQAEELYENLPGFIKRNMPSFSIDDGQRRADPPLASLEKQYFGLIRNWYEIPNDDAFGTRLSGKIATLNEEKQKYLNPPNKIRSFFINEEEDMENKLNEKSEQIRLKQIRRPKDLRIGQIYNMTTDIKYDNPLAFKDGYSAREEEENSFKGKLSDYKSNNPVAFKDGYYAREEEENRFKDKTLSYKLGFKKGYSMENTNNYNETKDIIDNLQNEEERNGFKDGCEAKKKDNVRDNKLNEKSYFEEYYRGKESYDKKNKKKGGGKRKYKKTSKKGGKKKSRKQKKSRKARR